MIVEVCADRTKIQFCLKHGQRWADYNVEHLCDEAPKLIAARIAHVALLAVRPSIAIVSTVVLFVISEYPFLRVECLGKELGHCLHAFRGHDFQFGSAMLVKQLATATAWHERVPVAVDAVDGNKSATTGSV